MRRAIKEMERRRNKQIEYNRIHNITPKSIVKSHEEIMRTTSVADRITQKHDEQEVSMEEINRLHKQMAEAVALLEFEQAAEIRDRIKSIKRKLEIQEGRNYQKAQKNR
jgi:excinuclease ABC subunit B